MNLRKLFYLFLILPLLFVSTNCSDDESDPVTPPPPAVVEANVLVKHMEANDFINTTATPAMVKADDVHGNLIDPQAAKYYVMDIRAAADYAAGHIEGAVNVLLKDIVTHYTANNLASKPKVVIACYSGQTAGYATSLLRLSGFSNVYDLKWGMCSWNAATSGSWKNSIGNANATELVKTVTAKNAAGDLPTLSTGKTVGADILTDRINFLLTDANEGFGAAKISKGDVLGNPGNYYIVNYWSQTDYDWNHINGAIQYTPRVDLKLAAALKTLPTDKPIVVYCYTGQTSAHVAAYLRLIGYNAKSLLFGVNGMSYDDMPGTKFVEATDVHDYPLVQ